MKNIKMFAIIALVGFVSLYALIVPYTTKETVTATVSDKDRIMEKSSNGPIKSYYLVYTDKEVFKNEDSLHYFKFDSSSLHGKLVNGSTCTFTVYGFRTKPLSMYRNIVGVECGPEEKA